MRQSAVVLKGVCRTYGEVFKRRLAGSVAVLIAAWNSFVPLLNRVIFNVLKYKAHLSAFLNAYALQNSF